MQTVVAIADMYYSQHKELSDKAYSDHAEVFGGFPGVWFFVAEFAAALDSLLVEQWDSEERFFIDDVMAAAQFLAEYTMEHGFMELPAKQVAELFVKQIQ